MMYLQHKLIQNLIPAIGLLRQTCYFLCSIHLFSPPARVPSLKTIHMVSLLCLSQPRQLFNQSASSLAEPPMATSFPASGCEVVTFLPAQSDCPCSNVFVHWGDCKETACQGQAAAVSYSLQQFRGTTAGCHGGEAARRPCCCSLAGLLDDTRPGRIRLSGSAEACGSTLSQLKCGVTFVCVSLIENFVLLFFIFPFLKKLRHITLLMDSYLLFGRIIYKNLFLYALLCAPWW